MMAPPTLEKKKSSYREQAANNMPEDLNQEYEAALMTTMLQRMKSAVTQKMMGVVEQERALMLE
jgi:hypothetical protein